MLCEKVRACDALNAFLLCAFRVRRPVGAAGVIVLFRPKNVSCGNASSQSRFLAFLSHGEGEENVVYLFDASENKSTRVSFPLENVQNIAVDSEGNALVQARVNEASRWYLFSADCMSQAFSES